MYITQVVTKAAMGTINVHIETLGLYEDYNAASQAAIDFCQQGNYEIEKRIIIEELIKDGAVPFVSGQGWKQIAPLGFERTLADGSVAWIRIEGVTPKA